MDHIVIVDAAFTIACGLLFPRNMVQNCWGGETIVSAVKPYWRCCKVCHQIYTCGFIDIILAHLIHKWLSSFHKAPHQKKLYFILTWRGSKSDQWGVSSRARLLHCTRPGLTPAITANVGNSTVQFLVVGVCVRAHPLLQKMKFTLSHSTHFGDSIFYHGPCLTQC